MTAIMRTRKRSDNRRGSKRVAPSVRARLELHAILRFARAPPPPPPSPHNAHSTLIAYGLLARASTHLARSVAAVARVRERV